MSALASLASALASLASALASLREGRRALDRTGSLAIWRMSGGPGMGLPSGSRHSAEARSKRKPSTWYSSTHLRPRATPPAQSGPRRLMGHKGLARPMHDGSAVARAPTAPRPAAPHSSAPAPPVRHAREQAGDRTCAASRRSCAASRAGCRTPCCRSPSS